MSLRSDKVSKLLHRALAQALVEQTEREEGLLIARVVVTADLRQARSWIYGWARLNATRQKELTSALVQAIARTSTMKFTPKLIVLDDDSGDYITRIHKLLEGESD